jgi:hypothetical protein
MEKDLGLIILFGESKKLTMEKYKDYVEFFAGISEHDPTVKEMEQVVELKEMLKAYQTLSDRESIKILERLFIQLLGHINVNLPFILDRYARCSSRLFKYAI